MSVVWVNERMGLVMYNLYTIKQVWFTSFLEYRFSYIGKMFDLERLIGRVGEREAAHQAYWQQKVTLGCQGRKRENYKKCSGLGPFIVDSVMLHYTCSPVGIAVTSWYSNRSLCVLPVLLASAITVLHLSMLPQHLGSKSPSWQSVQRETVHQQVEFGIVLNPKTLVFDMSPWLLVICPQAKVTMLTILLGLWLELCFPGVLTFFPQLPCHPCAQAGSRAVNSYL